MSWKAGLRKGSFRGVKFEFEEVTESGGRRNHGHQYPLRDTPYTQDLGRRQRTYSIRIYIVGDDYVTRKKALKAACEKGGPGQFVHPLDGAVTVNCDTFDFSESKDNGRMCAGSITFMETGLRQFPAGITDPNTTIGATADALIDASALNFINEITVSGVPEFVRGALQGSVGDIGSIMDTLQNSGALNLFPGTQALVNQAATLYGVIKSLVSPVLDLITDKPKLARTMVSAYKGFGDLAPSPEVAVSSFQKLQGLQVFTRTEYTPLTELENRNRTATKRFNDTVALAQEARYVARYNFSAYEDALRARRAILAKLEAAGQNAADNEYDLIRDLSAQIVNALPGADGDLPRIQSLVLGKSLPALKVAYDLYGDASRAEEIAVRNKARHPGFLPGGKPLEVLSDA